MRWEWAEPERAHGVTWSIVKKCVTSAAQKTPFATLVYERESGKGAVHKILPAETQLPHCLAAGAQLR